MKHCPSEYLIVKSSVKTQHNCRLVFSVT